MIVDDKPPVGYGSPPVETRFRKGRSGNPKGRPRKPDDVYTLFQRVLNRKVSLRGEERKMPIREALIRRLRDLALSGDRRALDLQRRILEEARVDEDEYDKRPNPRIWAIELAKKLGKPIPSEWLEESKEE